MEKVITLFTGMLAAFALMLKQVAGLFHIFSNEHLQTTILYMTIAWLFIQISMNIRKWFNEMKKYFKRGN